MILLVFGFLMTTAATASVEFPQQVTHDNLTLQRIGTGTVRYAGIITVYDAALYAPASSTPAAILDGSVPKRLEIVYHRSIEAKHLVEAAHHILERQQNADILSRWQSSIEKLHAAYRDVSPGDRFALAMSPEQGVWLEFNGREQVRIDNTEFGRLYFGIWLGDAPLSASLRDALLSMN